MCGNSIWHIYLGRRVNFDHLSYACILQTGPNFPFLPKLVLNFYISGLKKKAIDLKFGPVVGIDNRSLLWKFQPDRTSGYAEGEHFRQNTDRSVKYQRRRWPTWNFAHCLRWSRPITGENFKSKALVVPEFRKGGVYFTDRSVKYQILPWNHFFSIFWFNLANKHILNKKYQASWLIHSYSQFDILVCKIPTKQVADLKFCKWSSFVNICHWWKFQVHSTCQSWDPRGGGLTCPSRCFAYKKIGRCSKG